MSPDPKATLWELLQETFSQFPEIDTVILYGSRAIGTNTNGSDIDIALTGEDLTFETIVSLKAAVEELDLPYQVDICQLETLQNRALIDHIERVGKLLYARPVFSKVSPR